MKKYFKHLSILLAKQYAAIGGQAVIEGVMMRSPNAFVVAVRKPDGEIRLRRDQWVPSIQLKLAATPPTNPPHR